MALVNIKELEAVRLIEAEGYQVIDLHKDGEALSGAEALDKAAASFSVSGEKRRVAILNLMPLKETTEKHLLRRMASSDYLVEATLLMTESYTPKHTAKEHLDQFYTTFSQVKDQYFDGLMITGAPLERFAFEEVAYWKEVTEIMTWAETHVGSVMFICWGGQAGVYHYYGIPVFHTREKISGIYEHRIVNRTPITTDMEDPFMTPHSRHTGTPMEDVLKEERLTLIASSEGAGVYLATDEKERRIFVMGHSEYDTDTLLLEYLRDTGKGMDVPVPVNYFEDDDPEKAPVNTWEKHSVTFYNNWLKYYADIRLNPRYKG